MMHKRTVILTILTLSVGAAFVGTLMNLQNEQLQGQVTPGTSQIVDDGDAGFLASGKGWQTFQHALGYKGDILSPATVTDPALGATWTFSGVSAGQYKFFVTFKAYGLLTNQAPYVVKDGPTSIGSATINQKVDPAGNTYDGKNWTLIGTFTVKGPSVSISLLRPQSLTANGMIADAARIELVSLAAPAATTAQAQTSSWKLAVPPSPGLQAGGLASQPTTNANSSPAGAAAKTAPSTSLVDSRSAGGNPPYQQCTRMTIPDAQRICMQGKGIWDRDLQCCSCQVFGEIFQTTQKACICNGVYSTDALTGRRGCCPSGKAITCTGGQDSCTCQPISCPAGYHLGRDNTCLPDSVCGDEYFDQAGTPREFCELTNNQGCPAERLCSGCQTCLLCGDTVVTGNEECEADYSCATGKSCGSDCRCTDSLTPLTANVTSTVKNDSPLVSKFFVSTQTPLTIWPLSVRAGETYDVYVSTQRINKFSSSAPQCPSNFWKIFNGSQQVLPLFIPFGSPLCSSWPDPANATTTWIRVARVQATSASLRAEHQPSPLPTGGNPDDPARRFATADAVRLVKVTNANDPAPLGVTLIDDGDQGFYTWGQMWNSRLSPVALPWTFAESPLPLFDDDFTSPGGIANQPPAIASWNFTVTPGTYEVFATYKLNPSANFININGIYIVRDGTVNDANKEVGRVTVNHSTYPQGPTFRGADWQNLGSYSITGNRLTVLLTNPYSLSADAVRIVKTGGPASSSRQSSISSALPSSSSSAASVSPCITEGQIGPYGSACCTGLVSISYGHTIGTDGSCSFPLGAPAGGRLCTKCGNGICGVNETICNCPADCSRPASSSSAVSASSSNNSTATTAWVEVGPPHTAWNSCNTECASRGKSCADSGCPAVTAWNGTTFTGGENLFSAIGSAHYSCSNAWGSLFDTYKNYCCCSGSPTSSAASSVHSSASSQQWTACSSGLVCTKGWINNQCTSVPIDCAQGYALQCSSSCGSASCSGQCCKCVATGSSSSAVSCLTAGLTGPSTPFDPPCCSGLTSVNPGSVPQADGTCPTQLPTGGKLCTNCGNGTCESWENKCNCPSDCPSASACGNRQIDPGEQCDGSPAACISGQICSTACLCALPPPSSVQWLSVGNSYLLSTLTDSALFAHGSYLYLAGGMDFWGATNRELRSADGLTWNAVASLPQPVANAASLQTGGRALILGGLSSQETAVQSAFETPNLLTTGFQSNSIFGLPSARYDSAALRVGNSTYLLGGFTKSATLGGSLLGSLFGSLISQNSSSSPSKEIYMHNGTRWTRIQPDLPFSVTKNDAFSLGGKLFILDRSSPRNIFMSDNGATWTQVSSLPSVTANINLLRPVLHKGAIWLLGKEGAFAGSAVASLDGLQWSTVTGVYPDGFTDFVPDHAVSFKDELWLLGTVRDLYTGGSGRNGKVLRTGANILPCGNGLVESGEQCDDGNTLNGDGCSSPACQIESGFVCDGRPSVCARWQNCDAGFSCSAVPYLGTDKRWQCGFTGILPPGCRAEPSGTSCGNDTWCPNASCFKTICGSSSSSISSRSSSSGPGTDYLCCVSGRCQLQGSACASEEAARQCAENRCGTSSAASSSPAAGTNVALTAQIMGPPIPGQNVEYLLTVTNKSSREAKRVYLRDYRTSNKLTLQRSLSDPDCSVAEDQKSVGCFGPENGFTLTPAGTQGSSRSFKLVYAVSPAVGCDTHVFSIPIVNVAGTTDTNVADNAWHLTVPVQCNGAPVWTGSPSFPTYPAGLRTQTDIVVTKEVLGPITPGKPVSYRVTMTNTGTLPANGVYLIDYLGSPPSLTYQSTGPEDPCTLVEDGKSVVCHDSSEHAPFNLASGASREFTLTYLASPNLACTGKVENVAAMNLLFSTDTNQTNNSVRLLTSASCVCGDGKVNTASENCDDGGRDDGDGCSGDCHFECSDTDPDDDIAIRGTVSSYYCSDGTLSCGVSEKQDSCASDVTQITQYSCSRTMPVFGGIVATTNRCPENMICQNGACLRNCALEGESVFASSQFGPTVCCSKNAGIKPSSFPSGDTCVAPLNGSLGTCVDNWWQTCGNATCDSREDRCNCAKDCTACPDPRPPLCTNGLLVPQLGPDANGCKLPPVCCNGATNPQAQCSIDLSCDKGTCIISSCTCR